ncbi:hypothetical protein ACFVU3_31915 [Streptomyces sp. NPDC058052]|uniref:hypothetical protein n=1 Tax=Streptomyces sp. NPDC058052 TaxID=3346316 RepID=UPI0036E3C5AC
MHKTRAPYVVPMEGETILPVDLTVTPAGVAYADPTWEALARDLDDVLWVVCAETGPLGRPAYAEELHPERQQAVMEDRLCAGCMRPASRNELGMLWLLPLLDHADDTVWEGVQTVVPPSCERCAQAAKRRCPQLRGGYVELRVREAEKIGVLGTLHPRPGQGTEPVPDAVARFDSPDLAFIVARAVVCELREVTVIAFGGTESFPS